jgi:two-component system, LytTR family, response regulator
MRVLVVDDEPVARRRLIRLLGQIEDVVVAGEAEDGNQALERIAALAPDLVLLDIRMPGLDGLTVARRRDLPPIIFTTAYARHAVEAFEVAAVDYLLKPIETARLREAIERARRTERGSDGSRLDEVLEKLGRGSVRPPRLIARRGDSSWLIDPRDVSRLRATDKYVVVRQGERDLLLEESLAELEEKLSPYGFCRVHRGEIVNLDHVRAVHRTLRGLVLELADGARVPVSRRRSVEIMRRLES